MLSIGHMMQSTIGLCRHCQSGNPGVGASINMVGKQDGEGNTELVLTFYIQGISYYLNKRTEHTVQFLRDQVYPQQPRCAFHKG